MGSDIKLMLVWFNLFSRLLVQFQWCNWYSHIILHLLGHFASLMIFQKFRSGAGGLIYEPVSDSLVKIFWLIQTGMPIFRQTAEIHVLDSSKSKEIISDSMGGGP